MTPQPAPRATSARVSVLRAADWGKAIMTAYAAWRQLRKHGGGHLELDLDAQTLTFIEL